MDLLEIFMYGLFFIVLFWAFADEFVNPFTSLNLYNKFEQFNPNLEHEQHELWYPLDPEAYYGYWGFRPYQGLWGKINPWWYYPYPYPTPVGYQTDSCVSKLQ